MPNFNLTPAVIKVSVRQGAIHNPLEVNIFTAVGPVNFPAEFPGGMAFRMVHGSTVVTGSATGDASGNVIYAWGTHDLDIPGTYQAYFTGTDDVGKTETFPRGFNLEITVVPTI